LPRSWIETTGNLVFWEQHQKVLIVALGRALKFDTNTDTVSLQGGHFAALERPEELKADLIKFADQVWPGITDNR
jgi:microsomal epoxide hydrolase